jgi:hypothetical protein
MPKIKLLKVSESGYDEEIRVLLSNETDGWEEVSNEDLELLYEYRFDLYREVGDAVVIVEQLEAKKVIKNKLPTIIEALKQQKAKIEENKRKYLQKEKERKAKLEAKKIEKAQKLLKDKGIIT